MSEDVAIMHGTTPLVMRCSHIPAAVSQPTPMKNINARSIWAVAPWSIGLAGGVLICQMGRRSSQSLDSAFPRCRPGRSGTYPDPERQALVRCGALGSGERTAFISVANSPR
jgi:hypothetical protein